MSPKHTRRWFQFSLRKWPANQRHNQRPWKEWRDHEMTGCVRTRHLHSRNRFHEFRRELHDGSSDRETISITDKAGYFHGRR